MDFLKVYGQEDLDSFPSGLWGIKEPETHREGSARPNGMLLARRVTGERWFINLWYSALGQSSEELDLVLLPGVLSLSVGRSLLINANQSPGVAFDKSLSRLGHGKGYYDRFLTSYLSNGRRRPLLGRPALLMLANPGLHTYTTVALSLREQVLEQNSVPMGEHDWKVDLVVTPDEILGLEKH